MTKLIFSKITRRTDLKHFIHLEEKTVATYDWIQIDSVSLNETQLSSFFKHNNNYKDYL